MIASLLFIGLAVLILFSAYFVISAQNLFRGASGLIAVLLGIAGMYLLLDAQFLSAVQVTVYVGGIVVLIVYVVLLVADVAQKSFRVSAPWRKGVAAVFSIGLFLLFTQAILRHDLGASAVERVQSASVKEIGRTLLSPGAGGFALAFEAMSVLLLAVLIGAVTIAKNPESGREKGGRPR
jgi:NADH-quinone oxidoreductase subunit J